MSYGPTQRMVLPVAFDLSAGASALFTLKLAELKHILIKSVSAIFTEVSGPATTPGVLSVGYKDQAVAEAEVMTMTDGGSAVGDEVVFDWATGKKPFDAVAGDTLFFRLKTAASGGTETGAGYFVVEYVDQSSGIPA